MHEYGLCEAIVDAVERKAGGRHVENVRVRIGALHRVVQPAFDQAFAEVASGTVADGATLDLVVIPAVAQCGECGEVHELDDYLPLCPACGSTVALAGGDELTLESITTSTPSTG